jgi:hypothetical protein
MWEQIAMKFEAGILVKTLSGNVVKLETRTTPGYWVCDDGRIYLAAALRDVSEDERKVYETLHRSKNSS